MDTRFVGHAVCTYFIPFISYLFYFIFKTDSMPPKDSLFSSSILAWKQYRSNAQTVKIFTWNLNDDLWCLVQFVSKNENCQVSSDLILFQNENKLRILLYLLQKLNQKPKSIQLNIHVVTFTLISNLATDYIQKRRGEPGLFSFEYNLSPKLISK